MKKLNRKQSEQNQKRLKREKEKAEYIAKIKYIVDVFGGEGTFALIPKDILEIVYSFRVLPFKVTSKNHPDTPPENIKHLHTSVKRLLHDSNFSLFHNEKEILLADFTTAGFSIKTLIVWCQNNHDNLEWKSEFANRMTKFIEEKFYQKAFDLSYDLGYFICSFISDLEDEIVWFIFKLEERPDINQTVYVMDFNRKKPEIKHFEIAEGRRPAICLSWYKSQIGFLELTIPPSLLGINNMFAEIPVKVYIQRHALRRLEERVDCLSKNDLHSTLFTSFYDPEVIPMGKNRALIAYRILNSKVGYLVSEYMDGAILIHTFLFITNNGTPEGKKLNELTGLRKLDKKYLTLDKLSSFIRSDIGNNEKLRSLFVNAGCGCLLEIEETVQAIATKHADNSNIELIQKYLNSNQANLLEVYE